jgi:hypothetical protein
MPISKWRTVPTNCDQTEDVQQQLHRQSRGDVKQKRPMMTAALMAQKTPTRIKRDHRRLLFLQPCDQRDSDLWNAYDPVASTNYFTDLVKTYS